MGQLGTACHNLLYKHDISSKHRK